ncbi:MAG: ISAs1 family transposase [Fimbriiglobus sp.]|jgi:predicted transposase YbfD/YdcC|nr:ISAs1 family transposase [Fimbriiglobus sp.]
MPQDLGIVRHFAHLTDPRVDRTKKHRLEDILVIALCAVLCGADSFEEIQRFGKAKLDWLKGFLALPHGIPSHDTFNRVFAALDPDEFSAGFASWTAQWCPDAGLRQVAIDGKALRSAPADTFSGCLHLVNAWAVENHLFLGQVVVEEGSHEIAAMPALLRVLDLKGALVTIDAAGCQKAIVSQIREQGGDYLIPVKGNQPSLQAAVQAVVGSACESELQGCDTHESREQGHGRQEERYVTVIPAPKGLPGGWPEGWPEGWEGVKSVVVVGRERQLKGRNASTTHYYISSLDATAKEMAGYVRGHWGVENGLHWCLDVTFREDANRTKDANAGANLGAIRRVATSLLKQDPGKGSIKSKRFQAALDTNYLLRVLQGFAQI